MRCEECLSLVEDYFDGELDDKTNDSVTRHLSACASCSAAHARLSREEELYLSYECDTEPAPAFWDNVMARATLEGSGRAPSPRPAERLRGWLKGALGNFNAPRFSPSLTALIVLAAIGLTAVVMRLLNSRATMPDPASVSRNVETPAPISSPTRDANVEAPGTGVEAEAGGKRTGAGTDNQSQVANNVGRKGAAVLTTGRGKGARMMRKQPIEGREPTPEQLVREAEQKYVAAIQLLSRDVNRRRPQLDSATAARFERTLADVDRTIADTRRASRRHPGDPVAAQYMLAAYSKKVDVLRAMIGY